MPTNLFKNIKANNKFTKHNKNYSQVFLCEKDRDKKELQGISPAPNGVAYCRSCCFPTLYQRVQRRQKYTKSVNAW
jgi:hypothetical protein